MKSAMPRGSQPARCMICDADRVRLALVVAAELQHVAAGQQPRARLRRAGRAGSLPRTAPSRPMKPFATSCLVI